MTHIISIVLAYIIDLIIGDPRNWPHPVKWFGSFIQFMERKWNKGKNRQRKGFYMLLIIIVLTFTLSSLLVLLSYYIHLALGIVVEAILIATTIAQKGLKDTSLDVYHPLTKKDLKKARKELAEIVGRDTDKLSEQEIVRGAVETVAENTSDGITAPLFWALIGGAPLALVYRAVNTCDSMVGYKNKRYLQFGRASAKFDDMINYVPARITAFIMLLVNKPKRYSTLHIWSYVRQDARRHASPNSGWLEATVAYVLQVTLGGDNYYNGIKKQSTKIGTLQHNNQPLQKEHIRLTIKLMQKTVFVYVLLIIVGGVIIELATSWF